jgi:hypothetical protein
MTDMGATATGDFPMSATHYTTGLRARPRNGFFSSVGTLFAILGAARSAAHAAKSGRRPDMDDLRVLGIDPKSFDGVRF